MKPNIKIEPKVSGTSIITGLVRLAFVAALEPKPNPSGVLKYSVTALFEKDDPMLPLLKTCIKVAALEKWGSPDKFPKGMKNPIRDGDEKAYIGFPGHFYIGCNSDTKPGIIDAAAKPITSGDNIYSGCWARLDINFYGYVKAGNVGIAAGLNNIQVLGDDEAFTGRQAAARVFDAVVADDPFEGKGAPGKPVDAEVDDMFG